MQRCELTIFSNFYCILSCGLNLFFMSNMLFCMYILFIMHKCIFLYLFYIDVTVLYYILASFQKINANFNVNTFWKHQKPFGFLIFSSRFHWKCTSSLQKHMSFVCLYAMLSRMLCFYTCTHVSFIWYQACSSSEYSKLELHFKCSKNDIT